jgi:anti-anti-sigma factor
MLDEQRIYVFELGSRGPYVVVTATGEIDVAAVGDLRSSVRHAAQRGPKVVADLRPVTFMDTFALRALVALQNDAMQADDWALHVIPSPSRAVQRILDLAGAREDLHWMSPEQLAD